ncbi:MAG: hypothetical protein R3204_12640, partial [Oceanospirillum sp.]|nr:hypothetical protein [Oceanospirillum sp.]
PRPPPLGPAVWALPIPARVPAKRGAPSGMERRFGRYHMQIWLICDRRAPLHQGVATLLDLIDRHPMQRKVRWSLDIDPQELI